MIILLNCFQLRLLLNLLIANNIISKEINNKIIFFLFKTNPSTPIKNKDNEKVIVILVLLIKLNFTMWL